MNIIKIKFLFLFVFYLFFFNVSYGADYVYNIADFSSNSFNNGISITTDKKAKVIIYSEATFSGSTQVSDAKYNIAGFSSNSFNNGLSINTGKKAKVNVDISLDLGEGEVISNDISFNIASFSSNSFNNGLSINTGKKAKVTIDKTIQQEDGLFIYGDSSYNLATFSSDSFNNGLPISTGKKAKVTVARIIFEDGVLKVEKDDNYNLAAFSSDSFNNGLPISTGKKAKVKVLSLEDFNGLEFVSDLDVNFFDNDIYDGPHDNPSLPLRSGSGGTGSGENLYINAKQFVFSFNYDYSNINVRDISNNIYNIKGPTNTIVMGDEGLIQLLITKNPSNNKKIEYGDSLVIADNTMDITDLIFNVNFVDDNNEGVMITYPYINKNGVRVINNNYPIIKGLYYPNRRFSIDISGTKYFTTTDEYGHFSLYLGKIPDGNYEITSAGSSSGVLFEVNNYLTYSSPYISNLYNDDYVFTDVFYIEGFANPGELKYNLRKIDGNLIKNGTVRVNPLTKKFSFMIGDDNLSLEPGQYYIEVWQGSGPKERKAFTLVGDSKQKIGIFNIQNNSTIPSLRPTFIGYSKESKINNDTIRVYKCDITNTTTGIESCNPDKKEFIGTTNADMNGFFTFTPLQDLENNKYYEFEFVNTLDTSKKNRVIIKTDTTGDLSNSQVTSIVSGLNVKDKKLKISGFTAPGTPIYIDEKLMGNSNDTNGIFSFEIDFVKQFTIKYGNTGIDSYEQVYDIDTTGNGIYNVGNNYFQKFDNSEDSILNNKVK